MLSQIIGILNVTRDSFSDGGRFLEPSAAIARGLELLKAGADIIDLGAQSTRPDAEEVPAAEEIRRLEPVARALKKHSATISIDTYRPEVMRAALQWGADIINDVTGFASPEASSAVRNSPARLIVMHSISPTPQAQRIDFPPDQIVTRVCTFFSARIAELRNAGIDPARLILDPGMGHFVGKDPQCSLRLLTALPALRELGPLCISTSRKSFIGELLRDASGPRPVAARSAGTLTTEIWCARHGVEFIRTHDVAALRDALKVLDAIRNAADDGSHS